VLAVWAANDLAHVAALDELLSQARRNGLTRLVEIAERYGGAVDAQGTDET